MDPAALFESLTELQKAKKLPPVHLWQPEHVGRIDIRIEADGCWFHDGTKIERQPLIDLFATILRKDQDDYFLITPAEKLAIEVVDVPFVAIDFEIRGAGRSADLLFTTNVGDYVLVDAEHAIRMTGARPYIHVRDGLNAVVHRNVYYRLVDIGIEEEGALYVYSQGARFSLGLTADPGLDG
jgi:hypothetical protein